MDAQVNDPAVGAIALAGSGEYTAAMRETDLALLETLGGAAAARVVVCPAAAGREPPASPARWAHMGVVHFQALGATVEPAMILNRSDAEDPRWLPLLEAAHFYYFSGGDPGYLAATLSGTLAWDAICRRYRAGAVLAGCSAGAMVLGGTMVVRPGFGGRAFQPGLGILPHVITLPHFDQWGRFAGAQMVAMLARSAPPETVIVGIDEDTALLRREGTWEVQGRQTVTVFRGPHREDRQVYQAGESVPLPFA